MDTLDFLQRVLPTDGVYCAFTPAGRGNRFFSTVADLTNAALAVDGRGQDTYFAIASFNDNSSRKAVNVKHIKVIPIDVDVGAGKPFASWKDGLKALGTFVATLKLPAPLVVRSGNGLHVYWVLDRALSRDEWSPLAFAMKAATLANKFPVDMGKIADAALVLRAVGTHNHKSPTAPKPVRVLLDHPPTTVAAMQAALAPYYTGATTAKTKPVGILASLAVRHDIPPAEPARIAEKCQQVRWAVTHQDQVPEPFWYALLGVAAYCEAPEATAVQWSSQHPGFSEEETLKKLAHWREAATGPTTCAKLESERPGGCKDCIFAKQRIGSPAMLGVRYTPIDTTGAAPVVAATDVPLPKMFKRVQDNGVRIKVTVDGVDIDVAPFDLYPLSYGYDEHLGYEVAQYLWDRAHVGWKVLTLRQAYLAEGTYREFVGAIADQGIVLETRKQTELFQFMLRAYTNELRKLRTVTNLYSTMGWKEDNMVFVLGDDLYRRDANGVVVKDTIRLASHVTRAGSDLYTTGGSAATWRAGTTVLRKGRLYAHQFSIGIGFASVLMQFTGLKGVTVAFHGPSGTGKTLAQLMQQSIWGDPEKLHFQSKFTANSLFHRFGLYGNLPMTIDEATQMTDKDVGDYLYWVSQGRDKARLNRSSEERAPREWALFSTLSTNKPLSAKLISLGDESDAQLARLLELRMDPSPVFSNTTDAGRKLHALFTRNYGWAGRAFIMKVMDLSEDDIRTMLAAAFASFPGRYGKTFSGVERFWESILVLVDLALRLAHQWDLIDFDESGAIDWALNQIDVMRDVVADARKDGFDLFGEYVNEHLLNTLVVYHEPNKTPYPTHTWDARGPIRVRVDVQRNNGASPITGGTITVDRTHFRQWFAKRGGNPREFAEQVAKDGADTTPTSKKMTLSKHTAVVMAQMYVFSISLRHPRLRSVLDGVTSAQDNAALHNVVQMKK